MTEHPTSAHPTAATSPPRGLSALLAGVTTRKPSPRQPAPPPPTTVAGAVNARAVARADELDRVVRAAMALHRVEHRPDIAPGELDVPRPVAPWCKHCWRTWPCDTARILGPAVLGDLAVEVDRVRAQAQP